MSKNSKSRARALRLKTKRSRKSYNRDKWREYATYGDNSKRKKRKQGKKSRTMVRTVRHQKGYCGNLACKICFPELHSLMNPRFQRRKSKSPLSPNRIAYAMLSTS